MSDSSKNPVRDRVLVLRVLVPSLEARLNDKMKEASEIAASRMPPGSNAADYVAKESLMDLDGVACEPSDNGSTRWNFHCDGASYPARLINLPCPVELHKTLDHAVYYKSCDIAQLLVVYEDEMAMEEAENSEYKSDEYPSYYHSGLTPPMKRVVERRFSKREHKAIPPPRTEVSDIEEELRVMIERISDSTKQKGKLKTTLSAGTSKMIEEVVEDVVDYQPWMDDYGKEPKGIEFDAEDPKVTKYPELWLEPEEIQEIKRKEIELEDKKLLKAAAKKEKTKKKKKSKSSVPAEVPVVLDDLHDDRNTSKKSSYLDLDTSGPVDVKELDNFDMDDIDATLLGMDDDDLPFGDLDL